MIKLTDKAKEKIKEIAQGEGLDHVNVRAKVIGGGCAGFTHDFYFEDVISDFDEVDEYGTIKIVVDPLSHQYLDGTTIDYVETAIGGGFKFLNPNITATCGCGSSFSV